MGETKHVASRIREAGDHPPCRAVASATVGVVSHNTTSISSRTSEAVQERELRLRAVIDAFDNRYEIVEAYGRVWLPSLARCALLRLGELYGGDRPFAFMTLDGNSQTMEFIKPHIFHCPGLSISRDKNRGVVVIGIGN